MFVWMLRLLVLVILAVSIADFAVGSIGCLNQSGKPVDWWAMIKLPYLPGNKNPSAASGYGYAYLDVNSPNLTYVSNGYLNNTSTGALAYTLKQIYSANLQSVGFLMYDDQDPITGNDHDSFGHTKGDVAFDSSSGFWLIHSVPRFPAAFPGPYTYPDDETEYGQSFLCVTYPTQTFNEIGSLFIINKPYVYSWSMTASLNETLPNIVKVLDGDFTTTTPATDIITLQSLGGRDFDAFAKNAKWNNCLYEDLVEPHYDNSFMWETWRNCDAACQMPSFCIPQYQWDSLNIDSIQMTSTISWQYTQDHSKWGVSLGTLTYACIGDINRQWSQNQRGGGTVCMDNKSVWSSFGAIVATVESCPAT